MTKENKQLLLKDITARFPYGLKLHVHWEFQEANTDKDVVLNYDNLAEMLRGAMQDGVMFEQYEVKPYLRRLSSMTEDEIKEILAIDKKRWIFSSRHLTWHLDGEVIDYLNSKMIDWRELISQGLALEAPEDMYNLK